jgi:hypothetical protein
MVSDTMRKQAAAAGLAVLAAWLFGPLLTCVHVEGFSASMGSIALHMTHDQLANYDRLFPFNLQFFAFSRLGLPAEWALRVTMWTGFLCLAGGSWVLVRRWTGAPPLVVALLLILTPGVAETGFFYNDNLLSAGLAVLSLALLSVSARPWASLTAGALFGYAVLARTDAMLLAPVAALILWRREGWSWRLVGHCAAFGAAAAGLASAILAAFGQSPFGVLKIATHAVALWGRRTGWWVQPMSILAFAGPISLGLAAVGLARLAWKREAYRLLLLAGAPLLYNLVYLGKVWEARQLAPLTPFIVAAAAIGFQAFDALRRRGGGLPMLVVVAATALVFVARPAPMFDWEGPRAVLGRLWSPLHWYRWQAATRASFGGVGEFVEHPPAADSAVVTDIWDADRYVHLQLQEHGYRPIDLIAAAPACAHIAEGFQRGATRIVHLRLHTPFVLDWRLRLAERFTDAAQPCLAALGVKSVVMVTSLSRMDSLIGAADSPWMARARARRSVYLDPLAGLTLTPAQQARLPDAFRRDAAKWLRDSPADQAQLQAHPAADDLSAVR